MSGQLPDQVMLREAREGDAEGIAYVHITAWQTAYREILPVSYLDALTPASRMERWQQRLARQSEAEFTFVAEAAAGSTPRGGLGDTERRLVGFAAGGPERDGVAPVMTTRSGESTCCRNVVVAASAGGWLRPQQSG